MLDGRGVWVWNLDQAGGVYGLRFYAQQHRVSHALIKVGDGTTLGRSPLTYTRWQRQFLEVRDALKAAGLRVLTWSYLYLDDPDGEAEIARWALDHGADGHVFDVEGECEGKSDAAEVLGTLMRQSHPQAYLAYAPLPVIQYHLSLPYVQFNRFCDAVIPQMYVNELGADDYPLDWLLDHWREWRETWTMDGRPQPVMVPALDGWYNASAALLAQFSERAPELGIRGVSVWEAAQMSDPVWAALADVRLSGGAAPVHPLAGSSDSVPPLAPGPEPEPASAASIGTAPAPSAERQTYLWRSPALAAAPVGSVGPDGGQDVAIGPLFLCDLGGGRQVILTQAQLAALAAPAADWRPS